VLAEAVVIGGGSCRGWRGGQEQLLADL